MRKCQVRCAGVFGHLGEVVKVRLTLAVRAIEQQFALGFVVLHLVCYVGDGVVDRRTFL